MIYIHAATYAQASAAARDMRAKASGWKYIRDASRWRGMRGASIVMVDNPRYMLDRQQEMDLQELSELIHVYENEVVEWVL